jgi:hypothetical protein
VHEPAWRGGADGLDDGGHPSPLRVVRLSVVTQADFVGFESGALTVRNGLDGMSSSAPPRSLPIDFPSGLVNAASNLSASTQ